MGFLESEQQTLYGPSSTSNTESVNWGIFNIILPFFLFQFLFVTEIIGGFAAVRMEELENKPFCDGREPTDPPNK